KIVSERPAPLHSTSVAQSPSAVSSTTSPASMLHSRPWLKAKPPVGKPGDNHANSWISRRRSSGLVVVTVVMAFGIGARPGVEGCVDLRDGAAKLFSQVGEHVIGANTQPSVEYLHRYVPVAEMPSNPHQRRGGMRIDLEERLSGGADHHDATSFQG